MKKDKRTCPECGETIQGRADKRFCTDQCRSQYNNRLNSVTVNTVRQVNARLKRNRKILEKFVSTQKIKTSRETLLREGFDFRYMTHQVVTRKGTTYFFCYEYGYLPIHESYLYLVKAGNEKESLSS